MDLTEDPIVVGEAPELPPGHYLDLDNDTYQKLNARSKGQLTTYGKSPRHYWARHLDPEREAEEKSEALLVGDAIHAACMEPDRFETMFIEVPEDAPRRPTATQLKMKVPSEKALHSIAWWEKFDRENEGRIALSLKNQKIVKRCRDAVHTHPKAKHLMRGQIESSFIVPCPRTGIMRKVRPDILRLDEGMIVDLKSTADSSDAGFAGSITSFGYDEQEAMYKDVVNDHYQGEAIEHFIFVSVEKTLPWSVGIHWVNREDIDAARWDYRRKMDLLHANLALGPDRDNWPDYGFKPGERRLRRWKREEREDNGYNRHWRTAA